MLRTEESIMNLNFGFRNEDKMKSGKPVSKGISLKKRTISVRKLRCARVYRY